MHYETCMRDPVFYQLYKRIMHFYYDFKKQQPMYTYDDLFFDGVTIKDVKMDKLVTYFDYFDSDISNVFPMDGDYFDYKIFARQKRINHKPFTYTMNVFSDTYEGKATLRVFMGPKFYKDFDFNEMRKYFVELDQYVFDVKKGENTFFRNSREFAWTTNDRTTYTDLYKKVMFALEEKEKFPLDMSEAHCGWPNRLLLPKGREGGFEMKFFFVLSKFIAPKVEQYSTYDKVLSCGVGSGSRYVDDYAFGFPLDRKINFDYFFSMKNFFWYDTFIYHESNINVVN